MQRFILIFMILLPTADLCGQATAHTFSGDYDQVSLDSFVETLEESSGLVFFIALNGPPG